MPVFRYEYPEIYKIANMRHRVMFCKQDDVVLQDGQLILTRQGIRTCWARIDERRGSLTGPDGLTVRENAEKQSHLITVRYQPDLDIRSSAWVYDIRLKSPPTWYKILGVADSRLVYSISVRQVERADTAAPPVAESAEQWVKALPESVKL